MNASERLDLVGIGVSVWDHIRVIESYPDPGAVIRSIDQHVGVGGGVTVAIATAAKLGSRTVLIDALGDDPNSDRIVDALANAKVDTQFIERREGRSASSASIWASRDDGERTIVYSPGSASERLRWNPGFEAIVASAQALHVNGRHLDACLRAIEVARRHGTAVSFDGGAYRYRQETIPILESSDLVIVARQYAEAHYAHRQGRTRRIGESGELGAERLAEFLIEDLDCQIVGVTDGASGSIVIEREGTVFRQDAIEPDRAIDTTGCGDTYHGAFLHAWCQGKTVKQATQFAAEVASENARLLGAYPFATTNP